MEARYVPSQAAPSGPDSPDYQTLARSESQAINPADGAVNTLRVDATGKDLTLYVNNQFLTDVSDNSYSCGAFGIFAFYEPNGTSAQGGPPADPIQIAVSQVKVTQH